uniref:Uncharacterized protein n=1 Tax=Arundo donax TaxID=35708 RepID=A0A0A9BVP5_ARUDO
MSMSCFDKIVLAKSGIWNRDIRQYMGGTIIVGD